MRTPALRNRIYNLIVDDLTNCESDHTCGWQLNRCPDCPVLIHKPTVKHDWGCFPPAVAHRTWDQRRPAATFEMDFDARIYAAQKS
jgi:hypothetical protein